MADALLALSSSSSSSTHYIYRVDEVNDRDGRITVTIRRRNGKSEVEDNTQASSASKKKTRQRSNVRLSDDERNTIVNFATTEMTYRQIAASFLPKKISESCIKMIVSTWKKEGRIKTKPKGGSKRKFSEACIDEICEYEQRQKYRTARVRMSQ
jgi:hypothetical protein